MTFLRMNTYACDLQNVNLDKVPKHQLPLIFHSVLDQINVICKRKLRLGNLGDGGWEVCDDVDVRPVEPCIVYSFGIYWDFSFDDAMANTYGCHVYSFDPLMKKSYNHSDKVHFFDFGVGWQTGHTHPKFPKWKLYFFKDLREKLGHADRKIDLVKMDIEFSEWAVLPDMAFTGQMDNVKQILIEFHGDPSFPKLTWLSILKTIQSFEKLGFKRFDVNKNANCEISWPHFPGKRSLCYEVHYLMRNLV